MSHYPKALMAAGLLLLATAAAAESDRWTIDGYCKSFSVAFDLPDVQYSNLRLDQPMMGSVSNRLRLNTHYRASANIGLSFSYAVVSRIQDADLFETESLVIGPDPSTYRAADLDDYLYPASAGDVRSFAVAQNLDRAFITVKATRFDFYAGRQAVAWGSARVVNPTDVIAPYTYSELDTEDRIGVDALRFRYPLGFMGEIDAGWVFGKDFAFERSAVYLRGKFYAARTDISLIASCFRNNLMLGVDLTRAIGGAGCWLEAAQVFIGTFEDGHSSTGNDYFRVSVGSDYSFGGSTYGFVEYHFNQAGSNHAEDFRDNLSAAAYTEGSVYLLGQHYLAPGVIYQLTPLVSLSGQVLVNLGDPSALAAPTIEYNIAENIYLAAGAYVGFGKNPEVNDTSEVSLSDVSLASEFGTYPDTYFTSFRVYF